MESTVYQVPSVPFQYIDRISSTLNKSCLTCLSLYMHTLWPPGSGGRSRQILTATCQASVPPPHWQSYPCRITDYSSSLEKGVALHGNTTTFISLFKA